MSYPFPASSRSIIIRRSIMTVLAVVGVVAAIVATPSSVLADQLPAHVPDATIHRSNIPAVYNWNLSVLFPSDQAWRDARLELNGQVLRLDKYRGKLSDPAMLEECLDLYFDLHDRINHITMYAALKLTTALSDTDAVAMQQSGLKLMDKLMKGASFIRAELLAIPGEEMEKAYEAREGLAVHRPYIDNILRRADRILSPEAERVLALAGDNLWAEIDLNEIPSSVEDAFNGMMKDIPWPVVHDENGNEVQLTLANYGRFRASENRDVRKEAVTAFMSTLYQYRNALAATLVGQYKLDITYARARNYDTALQAYLDKDGLTTAVYDNLIDTIHSNLEPLHRYVGLRKKALKVDDLYLYDLYIPIVPDVAKKVPFEEARSTILQALRPLGNDYMKVLEEGLDPRNGWIDLYPCMDKDSGASSSSVYGRHPWIKMNYQDSLDDMSTLAHEFGHALHSHLAMENQPYSSFRYVPFLAEVASTCNEVLLNSYLAGQAEDKATRAYILTELAESIRQTIYRQTLFAEFEKKIHGFIEDGIPVTPDLLEKTYSQLIERYYGPGFTVGEHDGMEWAYIPHFYYKYYVFTYATGLSSGIAIAEKIKDGDPEAVDAYLGMLAGGCSRPPLDLLKSAGVDLTEPDAIESAMRLFDETVKKLEELL